MTLARAVQELRDDPDFRRGFRRGIGFMLAAFVISQCLICAFYPLIVR